MDQEKAPGESGSFFASPEYASPSEVAAQVGLCLNDPLVCAVLEAVGSYALVINAQRQILAMNPALMEAMKAEDPEGIHGLRMGEALGCVHADEGPSGCGTSKACRQCGALLSVLASQSQGEAVSGECLMSILRDGRWEAREFAVRSHPLEVGGVSMTLLTLHDICAVKRRAVLERIFIHDLMNSLQGLRGWSEVLQGAGADAPQIAGRILSVAHKLTLEVESQQKLLQAEGGELVAQVRAVAPEQILDQLLEDLGPGLSSRVIREPVLAGAPTLRTDPAILCRVLGNMVKNALEALPPGGQARIWLEWRQGRPTFVVQNPGCIPPEIADRIFHRSFSTKASSGRGLGTYEMKVLGETVLGGKVGFTTNWEEGTRFFVELPAGV
jgi:hypothetical protein